MRKNSEKTYQIENNRNAVKIKFNTSINRKSTYCKKTIEVLSTDNRLIIKTSVKKERFSPHNEEDKFFLPKIDKINLKSEYYSEKEVKPYLNTKNPRKSLPINMHSNSKLKKNGILTPVIGMNKILNNLINFEDNYDQNSRNKKDLNSSRTHIPDFYPVSPNNRVLFNKINITSTPKKEKPLYVDLKYNIYKTDDLIHLKKENLHDLIQKTNDLLTIKTSDNQEELVCEASKLFIDYSYKEDINLKYKKKMEDFHKIFQKNENEIIFSLYDGHGGNKVAKYAKDRFPEIFFALLNHYDNNVEKSFQESIKKIENELNFPKAKIMGTTLSIIYICNTNNTRFLYCSNVGDTRCLLISSDKVNRISYDHKIEDKNEIERIKNAGGYVQYGRLMGIINLSRSIGDLDLKKHGLISFPNFFKIELTKNDQFVIMASDGIWDVISDIDAYKMSKFCESSESFVEELVKKAIKLGSRDNISCLAIKL